MVGRPVFDTEYFDGRAGLIAYPGHADERGVLIPLDFERMPFTPCRSFVIADTPAGAVRGGHAHRAGAQMLVCLRGRVEILMRHGGREAASVLEPASFGLVFGPGVWCQQKYLDEGSILLVFASEPYDPGSYIEHWT